MVDLGLCGGGRVGVGGMRQREERRRDREDAPGSVQVRLQPDAMCRPAEAGPTGRMGHRHFLVSEGRDPSHQPASAATFSASLRMSSVSRAFSAENSAVVLTV